MRPGADAPSEMLASKLGVREQERTNGDSHTLGKATSSPYFFGAHAAHATSSVILKGFGQVMTKRRRVSTPNLAGGSFKIFWVAGAVSPD